MRRETAATPLVMVCMLLVVGLNWGFDAIRPAVKRRLIRTAVVERGDVRESIMASGTVVPAFEEVLTCPIRTTVLRRLREPGDVLEPGDRLLVLDTRATELALGKIDERIRVKDNRRARVRVDLEVETNDLEGELACKQVRLASYRERSRRFEQLHAAGSVTGEQLREVRLEMDIVRIEIERIRRALENAGKLTRTRLDEIGLEIEILKKEKAQLAREIERAAARVEREGVLTWLVEEPGTALNPGDVVARIADLDSFRVEAKVSDVHASGIRVDLPAIIRINDETVLNGVVAAVLPGIEDGILTFMVDIEDDSHHQLRANLRTDIYVVASQRHDVIRIQKGAFAQGNGTHEVFRVVGDRAEKTSARFGTAGFEHYEVIDGLTIGDEVIISDMKDHLHLDQVVIR